MTTPSRATVTQRTQLGLESSYGVAVAQAFRLPTLAITPAPEVATNEYRTQGNKFASIIVPNKEWSTWKYDGAATYAELAFLFSSLFAATTPVTGVGSSQQWTMQPSNGGVDLPNSFTLGHGDDNDYIQTVGNVVDALTIDFTRADVKVSGSGIGHAFDTTTALAALNSTQVVTLTGATGGTFTLSFKGQTTAAIAYNAIATAVQSALQALPAIGSGGMTVTGTGPWTVTIAGSLAQSAQPLMTADASLLTGTTPTAVVSVGTGGITLLENIPIQPGSVTAYLDTSYGSVGTTKLDGLLSGQIAISGRWNPEWVVDASLSSYGPLIEGVPKASAMLSLIADQAQAMSYFATYRAGTLVYLQIQAVGPVISGGTTYLLKLTLPMQFSKPQTFKDDGGVYGIDFELTPIADPTAGFAMQAEIVNQTAAFAA